VTHCFPDDRKGVLPNRFVGRDIIRSVEKALVDLAAGYQTVDLDRMGALDLDRVQFRVLDHEVVAFADLVAAALVLGSHRLAGLLIDELLAKPIAGGLVDLPESNALHARARRMQRDRARDQCQFEIAFPVRTHGLTRWFGV